MTEIDNQSLVAMIAGIGLAVGAGYSGIVKLSDKLFNGKKRYPTYDDIVHIKDSMNEMKITLAVLVSETSDHMASAPEVWNRINEMHTDIEILKTKIER